MEVSGSHVFIRDYVKMNARDSPYKNLKYHFNSATLKRIYYLQALHSLRMSLLTITLLIKHRGSKCWCDGGGGRR
jgi:hypothetical protein